MESTVNERNKMDQSYLIRLKSLHIWEYLLMGVGALMEWLADTISRSFSSTTFALCMCLLIVLTCVCGDYFLSLVSITNWPVNGHMIRAVTDSSTHALVGALVWAVAEHPERLNGWKMLRNCLFCAFLAMVVDLDHFLAAGSLDLKKALSLKRRPYFHNTSLTLVVGMLCMIMRHYKPDLRVFSLMFLSSWLSHHLRDANHRGLWLFPFGHTPLIPSYLYIVLILLLALSVRIVNYATSNARSISSPIII